MKKLLTLILLAAVALTLSGCGKKKPARTKEQPTPVSAPAPVQPAPVPAPPPPAPVAPKAPAVPARLTASEVDWAQKNILTPVYFDLDKHNLSSEATALLDKHAAWLREHAAVKLSIEGHCDERGTVDYNLALGEKRAQSARQYLVSLGISAGRLSTISYGKERPADARHNESAWAKNRRGEFVISEY